MTSRHRALLSVYDKTGVEALASGLVDLGFELISSGGTSKALAAAGISLDELVAVSIPDGMPWVAAMQMFLDEHKLTCVVRSGKLQITTPEGAKE